MKPGMTVDTSELLKSLKNIKLTKTQVLAIQGAGAAVVIREQRRLVPVLTGATRSSVQSHITEMSDERIVDEIGPETVYAPVIEYGRSDMPNYPIQPFVRPAAENVRGRVQDEISEVFRETVERRWQT